MGMEGTLPQNGPQQGSALGDPWGALLSHPGAGDSMEAMEQSWPLHLSAPLKKVSSFRKCKWSSRCWTMTSWGRMKP